MHGGAGVADGRRADVTRIALELSRVGAGAGAIGVDPAGPF
jgi:hypothetical protein